MGGPTSCKATALAKLRRVEQAVARDERTGDRRVEVRAWHGGGACATSVAGVRECDGTRARLRLWLCAYGCGRVQCAPEMGAVAYTAIITLTPQTAASPKVPTPLPAYLAAQTTPQPPWMISPVPTHSATHLAMSDGWLVVALGVLPCSWEASHSAGGIANPLWSTPAAAPSATAEAEARLQCGVRARERSRDSMIGAN